MVTKALFFDIDGTLVSFKTHQVPASTTDAIRMAREQGHKIFISTGRPKAIINNLGQLTEQGLIDGYITMNGAYCFAGNEVIYRSPVPQEALRNMLRLCDEQRFPCIFVAEHRLFVCHPDERVKQIFHEFLKVKPEHIPVCRPAEIEGQDIFQMTPFLSVEAERDVLPLLPGCETSRWFPAFSDITRKGNNKQNGVDQIINHFHIPLEDTVSFGDGGNDTGMLRHTAIGIAMGNAMPEVQEAADYVTWSVDEDGIYHAMKHFRLI